MDMYRVNVRAIVNATCVDLGETGDIPGWEVYDVESVKKDAGGQNVEVVIRCDQGVEVQAKSIDEAEVLAHGAATGIEVKGWIVDNVHLWCDKSIDFEIASEKEKNISL